MGKIIIIAPCASGKEYLIKKFEAKGFTYGVTCTTRPKRSNEVDGADYYFLSDDDFKSKINSGYFMEYVIFNGWYYGTPKNIWNNSDMFIMSPTGYKKLDQSLKKSTFVIYLDIPEDTRRYRLLKRNDADDVERRILADKEDFNGITQIADIRITNDDF